MAGGPSKILMGTDWIEKYEKRDGISFYFAGENKVTVSGRECEQTMRKAIERILASLKAEKTNSFEITRVALRSFLGMPFTSVFFHVRNIQKSMFLLGDEAIQPWKDAGFVAA